MGWYNSIGFMANAIGAGFASVLISILQKEGWSDVSSYRMIVLVYSFTGFLTFILYILLNSEIEVHLVPEE